MPAKQNSSPKLKRSARLTPRGSQPGDKEVIRRKKTGASVSRMAAGEDLMSQIRNDRMASRPHYTDGHVRQEKLDVATLQRQQANRAYASLKLTPGTFEAKLCATFIQAWLAATPDKFKGESKTGLARQTVMDGLTSDQEKDIRVKPVLDKVAKAIKDAFVPIG